MPYLAEPKSKDPSMQLIECEICGVEKPLRDMKSMGVVYRMPGYDYEMNRGLQPFGCPDRQHFGCTHEHAMLAQIYCLFEHMHEGPHDAQGNPLEHKVLVAIQNILEDYVIEAKQLQQENAPEESSGETSDGA